MNKTTTTVTGIALAAAIGSTVFLSTEDNTAVTNEGHNLTDDIAAVQVDIPEIENIQLDIPKITSLHVNQEQITSLCDEEISAQEIPVITVSDPTADIPRYATIIGEQQMLLRDKRNIQHDPALNSLASTTWEAWKKIYQDPLYLDYIMEYKPLSVTLRIINEVWCPKDHIQFKTMIQRLKEYRHWGYNAVLVCFDTSENLMDLLCTVDYIKASGMKVVIVYTGGREDLHDSVFRDPANINRFLTQLAPRADALLLGWWRTSVHLFIPDAAYTNYIVKTARTANPDLPIIGQAYWGQTAETGTDPNDFRTTVACPENASAVLVMGMGYPGSANRQTLNSLFSEIASHPHKIALVAGERPYFDSHHSTNRTASENRKIKRSLELRLLRAGFQSTMTFSGDGSNGGYDKNKTENLCQEYQ